DGKTLYYLSRITGRRSWISGGLWAVDLASGRRVRMLPDFQIVRYSISADGHRIAFVAVDEKDRSLAWLAPPNGSTSPHQLSGMNAFSVFFGTPGEVILTTEDTALTYS